MNTENQQKEEIVSISPVIEEVKSNNTPEQPITAPTTTSNTQAFELQDLTYNELIECYEKIKEFIKYLSGLSE